MPPQIDSGIDVRESQDRLLDSLQTLDPERIIRVQVTLTDTWAVRPITGIRPYLTRGILANEVIFDLDHNDARIRNSELGKLRNNLMRMGWPHYVCATGGKGCHVHLFLDPKTLALPDTWKLRIERLKEVKGMDFDVWRQVRTFVGDKVCKEAMLVMEHVTSDGKVERWIDRQKYTFNTQSKGNQIRMVGCERENGRTKTLLDDAGNPLPIPTNAPKLVSLSVWQDDILAHIDKQLSLLENRVTQPIEIPSLDGLACIAKLRESGAPEGKRNSLALPISVLLRCAKVPEDQAIQIIDEYSGHCENPDEENASSNRNTLRFRYHKEQGPDDARISCYKLRKELGDDLCDCSNCPVRATLDQGEEILDRERPVNTIFDSDVVDISSRIQHFNWEADEKEHSIRPLGLKLVENGTIIVVFEVDGVMRELVEDEALRQWRMQPTSEDWLAEAESVIYAQKVEWLTDDAWPDGGDRPIFRDTFTPQAAQTYQLIDRYGDVRINNAVTLLMDHVRFEKLQLGEPAENSPPSYLLAYYRKGTYHFDSEDLIGCILEAVAPEEVRNSTVAEVVGKLTRNLRPRRTLDLNRAGWRCLENGIINIMTGEFCPHTPDMVFTRKQPVSFDKDARCPAILTFLSQVAKTPELAGGLIELFAWVTEPGYAHQWVVMCIGEGANGKSVLLHLIQAFLGNSYVSNVILQDLCDRHKNFYRAELFGRTANIAEDIGNDRINNTGELKNLSGGGRLTADRKYCPLFTFYNEAKLVFSSNSPPVVNDDSHGMNRRWRFLDFPHKFEGPNCDEHILDKLTTPAEMSGLLNEVLLGIQRLEKNKEIAGADNDPQRYPRESNSVEMFLDEYVTRLDPNTYDVAPIAKASVYKSYWCWCHENGITLPQNRNAITQAVEKRYARGKPSIECDSRVKFDGENNCRTWANLHCDYAPTDAALDAFKGRSQAKIDAFEVEKHEA